MTTRNNISINHNKDYDHTDDELWSYEHLVDNIINDLMNADNKYIHQAITKFKDFKIKSPVTFFDIHKKDFKYETTKLIEHYIKDCKTSGEAYDKLDGIITEVIAWIYKEAEPLILSTLEFDDPVRVKRSINEVRTTVSKKWRFV